MMDESSYPAFVPEFNPHPRGRRTPVGPATLGRHIALHMVRHEIEHELGFEDFPAAEWEEDGYDEAVGPDEPRTFGRADRHDPDWLDLLLEPRARLQQATALAKAVAEYVPTLGPALSVVPEPIVEDVTPPVYDEVVTPIDTPAAIFEPPPGERRKGKWDRLTDAARSRPGEWARTPWSLKESSAKVMASSVRNNRLVGGVSLPLSDKWETIAAEHEGQWYVWIRFVGASKAQGVGA